jgi:hypothetical protein
LCGDLKRQWSLRLLKFLREKFAETEANKQTFGEVDSCCAGGSTKALDSCVQVQRAPTRGREKKEIDDSYSFSVTSFTLGFRLFFNLPVEINFLYSSSVTFFPLWFLPLFLFCCNKIIKKKQMKMTVTHGLLASREHRHFSPTPP